MENIDAEQKYEFRTRSVFKNGSLMVVIGHSLHANQQLIPQRSEVIGMGNVWKADPGNWNL